MKKILNINISNEPKLSGNLLGSWLGFVIVAMKSGNEVIARPTRGKINPHINILFTHRGTSFIPFPTSESL